MTAVDLSFTKALPKAELHAHLSGSISKTTLHNIWLRKQAAGQCLDLEDPSLALSSMPDIFTFFKIFDQYIYKLLDDEASIRQAVISVIDDFKDDGVAYLELRTTPRFIGENIDRQKYVQVVLDAIADHIMRNRDGNGIEVHLLLSIDRKMDLEQAAEILAIAERFQNKSDQHNDNRPAVLGVDLCGNPARGDVSIFTPVFLRAKEIGLRTTVHFAEIPASSTEAELLTILSWKPDRLGHVICVPEHIKTMLRDTLVGLELCLSCNVIAKMVPGSFADHHFGSWLQSKNAIALRTDDVGVFESPLSNEYLLAAEHFNLGRADLTALSRRAVVAAFAGQGRISALLDQFERSSSYSPVIPC